MVVPSEKTPLQPEPRQTENPSSSLSLETKSTCCSRIYDFYLSNSFLLKAGAVIIAAKTFPPLGAVYLCPQITATWLAVIFIFIMAGLSLKSNEFAKAATRLDFNAFVLAFNFLGVSFIVYCMTIAMRYINIIPKSLTDGMILCACMPITVSMVIVLTISAKGDEAVAILLAAVGSLMGLFISPALVLLYIGVQPDIALPTVILKLILRVLVPLLFGQFLQHYSAHVVTSVERNRNRFKSCQEWALVFIVYTVFCKTFSTPLDVGLVDVLWVVLFQCTALLVSMMLAWLALKLLFRDEPRLRVVGLFGCTQKSIAMGIPLIGAIYETDPRAGIFALPLLIWHPLQLLVHSALAPRLAQGADQLEGYLSRSTSQRRQTVRRSFFGADMPSARRASSVAFEPVSELLLDFEDEGDPFA